MKTKNGHEIVIDNKLNCAKIMIHSDTHGDFDVLIDIEDIEWLSQYNWCINKFRSNICDYYQYYALCNNKLAHRFITSAPRGLVVDHINHNTIDNRRENLRVCEFRENRKNNNRYKNNSCEHIGVTWYPHGGINKWMAHIMVDRKKITIGYYDTYEEACKAREDAEDKYYGEFANSNHKKN